MKNAGASLCEAPGFLCWGFFGGSGAGAGRGGLLARTRRMFKAAALASASASWEVGSGARVCGMGGRIRPRLRRLASSHGYGLREWCSRK